MPIATGLGATRLLRLQLGQESAWGTKATATSILHGSAPVPKLTPKQQVTQFDEQLGTLTPSFRSALTATGGTWEHTGMALFEDLLYTLGGAFGLPTPTLVSPKTITGISVAAAAVVTSVGHGFATGQQVLITGSDSTPTINGARVVTRLGADTFSVPVTTSGAGSHGSASGVVKYAFVPPVAATYVPLSLTMELGNVGASGDASVATGCLLDTWSIKGEQSKELTYSTKGFFKTFLPGQTLTTGLPLRTVETILMPETLLALDIAGVTPGTGSGIPTTSLILVTFELSGTAGLKPVYAGGSLAPVDFTYEKQDLTLKLGLLWTPALEAFLATTSVVGSPMIVDLKTTSGAKVLEVPYSGVVKADPVYFTDSQGAQMIEIELGAQYDAALGNYCGVNLTTDMVALP